LTAPCPYDEKYLLAKIAEGDESAFRELFLHWSQQLAGYIYAITESTEGTEEIVQDVFMKIWTIRDTLTGINNFKHFLWVIGRNKAFDAMRKRVREKALRHAWEQERALDLPDIDDSDEMLRDALIERAIESLPSRRKEVFLLSRDGHLTYREIASILNISQSSVKTHVRLASSKIHEFVRSNWAALTLLAISLPKIF
jgi:RNA polymerase sigma-70 factor (ECF subfamily)